MSMTGPSKRPAFVLHEHQKPRHHFDLRLEADGVLRSWALPRGLPRIQRTTGSLSRWPTTTWST